MAPLKECYAEYASKPGVMTTKDLSQLFTHAKLIKKTGDYSSNSIDIRFSKHKTKGKNFLTLAEFENFVKDIAKEDFAAISEKLAGTKKSDHLKTKVSTTGGVGRMTDTSKYTGSHKERFDESGKGKGAEGRTDKVDDTGYVGDYKGEGSYGGASKK